MSNDQEINSLQDVDARSTKTAGEKIGSAETNTWVDDVEARLAALNDAVADLYNTKAGSTVPSFYPEGAEFYDTDITCVLRAIDGSGNQGVMQHMRIVTITAATYTVTDEAPLILANPSAAMTITLPAAGTRVNKQIWIKNIQSSNDVTVDANGSETIDGNLTHTLHESEEVLHIISDGTNWRVLSEFNHLQGYNKIINGAMRIDQRDTDTTKVTIGASSAYSTDRWIGVDSSNAIFTLERSSVSPEGFDFSLLATCTTLDSTVAASQYAYIAQYIEGNNLVPFNLGTSDAVTISISWWVRSSLIGIYCIALQNSASNRSFVHEYTIDVADTWERKSVTLVGDTTGTWLLTNGVGIRLLFTLAIGTSSEGTNDTWEGADDKGTSNQVDWIDSSTSRTFYLTGVQFEHGDIPTPFDYQLHGNELMLCQRYAYQMDADVNFQHIASGYVASTSTVEAMFDFPVTMRTGPSLTVSAADEYEVANPQTALTTLALDLATEETCRLIATVSGTPLTAGEGAVIRGDSGTSGKLLFDAEL